MKQTRRSILAVGVAAGVWLAGAAPAHAAPTNDNFVDATPIALFETIGRHNRATAEVGEPAGYLWDDGSASSYVLCRPERTVWYRFTSAVALPVVATSDRLGVGELAVYKGDSLGSLEFVECNPLAPGGRPYSNLLGWVAEPGVTYYLRASNPTSLYGLRVQPGVSPGGGGLVGRRR